MSQHDIIAPTRRVLKPVLSDESVFDATGDAVDVFYTIGARRIARNIELIVAAVAGTALLIAWGIGLSSGPQALYDMFVFVAFVTAGIPALSQVWGKLSRFRIDIDLLMLLGAGLAAYIGNPFEGALLLFLFALSGGLEDFALRRTRSAIVALRKLQATEATVLEEGETRRIPLRRLEIGAIVLVRPGEKIPIDGTVVGGGSSVDESAITGESIPRDCAFGDAVYAGTQNIDGRLEIRTTKRASDTTLAKIVSLVTEARHHPATAQRLIDRIGPTYSLVVIVASILTGVLAFFVFGLEGREATRRAIALLIVASPCALIIATPVAYLSAMAAAARRGVLIKGGAHLEVVSRAGVVAFDKTGTLTTARIQLTNIESNGTIDEAEMLRLAGSIEASSGHPLAAAVNAAIQERGMNPYPVTDFRSVPGEGESGTADGRWIWIGRPELLGDRPAHHEQLPGHKGGISSNMPDEAVIRDRVEALREEGKTVSVIQIDGEIGLLAFQDTIRQESARCVERLREQGIARIEMLTGDHAIVARQVASRLKLDGYLAELAPAEKWTAADSLKAQHGTILLVGDGINDAPALAHADVGIAMGAMGADVALEAADIVLIKDRIEEVAWLHGHAKRTARIVRQNLTLAIAVISILSVFAVLGGVPLPLAVIGHEGSTVLVALNALRLLRNSDA